MTQTTLRQQIKCFIEGHAYKLSDDHSGVFADGKYRKCISSCCKNCGKYQHASVEVSQEDCK